MYDERPWGLYMARPTPGRTQFHYLESWLLPDLGLRASVFHFNPGHESEQDFYLDVGAIHRNGQVWTTEDHYLDLVVRAGVDVAITDVDEFVAAVGEGQLAPEEAERAMRSSVAAIDGLARHGYHLDRWLTSNGMVLHWRAA